MTQASQELYQQNLNDLIDQVTTHHAALMRCHQFSGHMNISADLLELVVDESDAVLLTRKLDLNDKFILQRLRGLITTMQEIMPASSAFVTAGGVA